MKGIIINTILYFGTFCINIFDAVKIGSFDNWKVVINVVKLSLYLCIAVSLFLVIIGFESNFTLKAQVHACGLIEIVGLNNDGMEVFKYYLGEEKVTARGSQTSSAPLRSSEGVASINE